MRALVLLTLALVPSLSLAQEPPAPAEPAPAVIQKAPARVRRWLISVDPFVTTLGGKLTTLGSSLRVTFEIAGGFGVSASVGATWLRIGGDVGRPGETLVSDFAGMLGVQYSHAFWRFHPFVRVGAALVASSHLVVPPTAGTTALIGPGSLTGAGFVPTGVRLGLGAGLGVAFQIIPALRVVVEVQYQAIPADVSGVSGCDLDDLVAMDAAVRGGQAPAVAMVKPSCSTESFSGADASGASRLNRIPQSLNLVRSPAGEVAHRFSPMLGVELAF